MANKSKYTSRAKVKIATKAKPHTAYSSKKIRKNNSNSSRFAIYLMICLVIGGGVIISLSPDEISTTPEITHEICLPNIVQPLTIGDEFLYELEVNGDLSYIKMKIRNIQGLDCEIYRIDFDLYYGLSRETISSSPTESGTFDISATSNDFFTIPSGRIEEGEIDDPTQISSLVKLYFQHPVIPEDTIISEFQQKLETMATQQEKFQITIVTTSNTIQIKLEMNGIVLNNLKSTYSTNGILIEYQFKMSNPRTGENYSGGMNLIS